MREPSPVLDDDRLVQPQLLTDLRNLVGGRMEPSGQVAGRVARDDERQREHEQADEQDQRHHGEEPPGDIAAQLLTMIPFMMGALQVWFCAYTCPPTRLVL